MDNFIKLEPIVEIALKEFPETRDSDKALFWRMFWIIYAEDSDSDIMTKEQFMDMPSFDSLSRIRRRFNEKGMYLPTAEVSSKRIANIKKIRKALGYKVEDERQTKMI